MSSATAATPTLRPQPRHFILGTAGHIDHGKTSLVRALTGIDTDRLPEERARGMTIELGFAHFDHADCRFSVVDVPGHERFVRTMVAGAQGIDIAVLVVAADDSVMPQTVEHVEILELLGIRHAVVALSKADRVDAEMAELVADDVRTLLEATALRGAPIVAVSAVTGQGLEDLKAALLRAADGVERTRAGPPFRMGIDRAFTVQGRGLVVTGSVMRGRVAMSDTLELWPAGRVCKVRQLQSHGEESHTLARGTRAALNLIGVEREHVERGMELATPGYLQASRVFDVRLACLSRHLAGLRSSMKARLCVGTREALVRIVLLGGGVLGAGQSGFAQLRSGEPLVATYGQRFILRDETAARTLGGGVILRPVGRRQRVPADVERAALQRLERGSEVDRLEEVLRRSGFIRPADLHVCAATGIELESLPSSYQALESLGRWTVVPSTTVRVVPAVLDDLGIRLTSWLSRFHREHPDVPGRPADAVLGWLERRGDKTLGRALLDHFIRTGRLKTLGRFVCLTEFAPALSRSDERLLAQMVGAISAAGFSPPLLDELKLAESPDRKRIERLATLAVATGQLVRIQEQLYLSPQQEQALKDKTAEVIRRTGAATVSEIREALGTSRKYCVPYMEYLDHSGLTRRIGDVRVLADSPSP